MWLDTIWTSAERFVVQKFSIRNSGCGLPCVVPTACVRCVRCVRLTGALPFAGRLTTQAMKRHTNGDLREDFTLHPEAPRLRVSMFIIDADISSYGSTSPVRPSPSGLIDLRMRTAASMATVPLSIQAVPTSEFGHLDSCGGDGGVEAPVEHRHRDGSSHPWTHKARQCRPDATRAYGRTRGHWGY